MSCGLFPVIPETVSGIPGNPVSGGSGSGTKDGSSPKIIITKEISPVSIKQGKEAKITVTVYNHGALPVNDVEILDTCLPELPVVWGNSRYTIPSLSPDDTRILTYTVRAEKAGIYRLNKTTVMYADVDGNYSMSYPDSAKITVIRSLLAEPDEEKSEDILVSFMKFIDGLKSFS
ncbi:MAG: DUF11 domain-containing protein [Methanomicrobiales archaeon]|nr:DUF11 domain-containing protein [Methanomicrobiales archaeon]